MLLLLLLLLVLLKQRGRVLKLSDGGRSSCRSLRLALTTGGGRSKLGVIRRYRAVVVPGLLGVVDKVATGPVRAEANAVERAAQFGLVLWMTLEVAQFLHAVRKLALVAVLALARFLERSAQLGFVSRRVDLLRQRFRLRSLQLPVSTTATTRSAVSPTATGLHQRYGTGRHSQQFHERFHRGRRRRRRRCCRGGRRHWVGRGPREGIVDQQLTGRVLV